MSVRKIIQIGHPALKAKNKQIKNFKSKKITKLITDLKDTMRKDHLIGVAAPQIGENYKLFATEARNTKYRKLTKEDKFRVFINPKITKYSKGYSIIYEGCGSVINGNLFGPVERPKTITINALDENGNPFQLTTDGLLARVIQHEYDHLSGIEFTEKIHDYKKLVDAYHYIKFIKKSKQQISASNISVLEYEKI